MNLSQVGYLMLKSRSPQALFYGSYLYDRIVLASHQLRRIERVAAGFSVL
jgi:hypothetical protein